MPPHHSPRILLVTDARLSSDDTGVGRTLINLLQQIAPQNLMVLHPRESDPTPEMRALSCRYRTFKTRVLPLPANRFGLMLRNFWVTLHCTIQRLRRKAREEAVAEFSPSVLLLCANTLPSLVEGMLIAQAHPQCPTVVYVMDDWKGLEEISCGKFNVKECLREVMQNAAAWIGVSETLLHQIATRYQISSPRRLILHNPPRLPAQTPRAYTPDAARRFRVIYAGSIWGMHFDALAAVARAVAILNDRGVAIELVIHTTEHFWREHRTALSLNGTVYGGQIPYESLSTALSRGDLLLVCSSFLESNELLAKGSLQTKTTDYMVSRRAVLAVGPAESASNKFIEQWKCGICITSQDPLCIAASLEQAVRNPQTLTALADAGYEAVKEHFCQTAAFSRFNSFLLEQSGANS